MIANNITNPGLDVYDIHCNRNSSMGGGLYAHTRKKKEKK